MKDVLDVVVGFICGCTGTRVWQSVLEKMDVNLIYYVCMWYVCSNCVCVCVCIGPFFGVCVCVYISHFTSSEPKFCFMFHRVTRYRVPSLGSSR